MRWWLIKIQESDVIHLGQLGKAKSHWTAVDRTRINYHINCASTNRNVPFSMRNYSQPMGWRNRWPSWLISAVDLIHRRLVSSKEDLPHIGVFPVRFLFRWKKMNNIGTLLQAAEYLERRERGGCWRSAALADHRATGLRTLSPPSHRHRYCTEKEMWIDQHITVPGQENFGGLLTIWLPDWSWRILG